MLRATIEVPYHSGQQPSAAVERQLNNLAQTGLSAVVSGTVASLATTAALALLAKAESKGALQPTNSTSHWLHGDQAGSVRQADAAHTLVGYGTHHASAVFWAVPFEAWLASRPPRAPLLVLRDASVISAMAAVVDYGIVPKRLTPGWEAVLSKRSIAVTFAAMAVGLAAGAMITRRFRREDQARSPVKQQVSRKGVNPVRA